MDWATILDQWGDRLYLYARQFVSCEAEAADVVQEAFVRTWRRQADRPTPETELPVLLFGTVRHAALDQVRRTRRRQLRETRGGEHLYAETPLFERPFERQEQQEELELALMKLPPEQREVVSLKIWGGLTFREIAETTGESPNTTASRYRLALATLRHNLEGEPPHA